MRVDDERLQREMRRQGLSEDALVLHAGLAAEVFTVLKAGALAAKEDLERLAGALGVEPLDIAMDE